MRTSVCFLLGFCLIAGFSACKKKSESKKLSYQYEVNGCDTGKHTFDSMTSYCAGLQDEALNKGCAGSLRMEDYKRNCQSNNPPD